MNPSPQHSSAPAASQVPPDVARLCELVRAATHPAGARMVLRAILHQRQLQPPTMPAEQLVRLAASAVAGGIDADSALDTANAAVTAYNGDIPAIQVDKILRGTMACDMPADVRSALRALAGHANVNGRHAWPDRETLAGETGVSVKRIDVIVADLCERQWITKGAPRHKPRGGKGPCTITLHPERGRWWSSLSRINLARRPPHA